MNEQIVETKQLIHKVHKDWGFEEWHVNNELYCKKTLWVAPRRQSSLHYHPVKDEWWQVKEGVIIAEVDGVKYLLSEGMSVRIRPTVRHRFINPSQVSIVSVEEISTTHKEEDVVRIELSRELNQGEWLCIEDSSSARR